jgi:hypothetical protein
MSVKAVKVAFEMEEVTLRLDHILPLKQLNPSIPKSTMYATIRASIEEMGVVEPVVVYPSGQGRGASRKWLLLDGHVRVEILKELGQSEVRCVVSKEFDPFTPNHEVNRLSALQGHLMLIRAADGGVREARLAKALNVDVARIREMRNALKGVCPEAVDLLRNKPINVSALRWLRKVKPLRQVEIASLLNSTNKYTVPYVRALILATPVELREESFEAKGSGNVTAEDMDRMQREAETLEREIKVVEKNHRDNMYNLVLASGYLGKLLANNRVLRFLSKRHSDMLLQFEKIVAASSLEE